VARGHATHIDSKVKWNLVMLVLWWLKQGFSISPHEPLLPAHAIVPSSNLGSNKLLAAIESDRCFYFIPEVVRMGVAGNTKCKSPMAFSRYPHAYLGNIAFEDYTCILGGCMQVHNDWKFLSFYSPSFLYSQIGWEHDRTGSYCGIIPTKSALKIILSLVNDSSSLLLRLNNKLFKAL